MGTNILGIRVRYGCMNIAAVRESRVTFATGCFPKALAFPCLHRRWRRVHPSFQVIASVQTLGRRGSGAARLRQYASYGGVVIVDEVSRRFLRAGVAYGRVSLAKLDCVCVCFCGGYVFRIVAHHL